MKSFILIALCGFFFSEALSAQNIDSLLTSLDTNRRAARTIAVFKSPTIVFSQSTELRKAHSLGLVFRHDFGPLAGKYGGTHTLFGLDIVQDVYIGFDYGISDRLSAGLGRSVSNEQYNLNIKARVLEQTLDSGMPVSVTLFAQPAIITRKGFSAAEFQTYTNRLSAFIQALVSRKFSSRLSLELSASYLLQARTSDFDPLDTRNLLSAGAAGRLKLTRRFSLLADYQLVNGLNRRSGILEDHRYYNPLGLGLEIETGGHVFSLLFQNTSTILENSFLAGTSRSWLHGGASFAFSISRDFNLRHQKKP